MRQTKTKDSSVPRFRELIVDSQAGVREKEQTRHPLQLSIDAVKLNMKLNLRQSSTKPRHIDT